MIGTTFAREYQDMVLQRKFQGLNAATRDKVLEDAKQMAEYEQDVDDEVRCRRDARFGSLRRSPANARGSRVPAGASGSQGADQAPG